MMARALPKLAMRPMLPTDVPLLAEIFRASIEELTMDDYSEAQQAAWASTADDLAEFGAKLAGDLTLVATFGGAAVGFASLADNTRIDMLYVHPAAARQLRLLVEFFDRRFDRRLAALPASARPRSHRADHLDRHHRTGSRTLDRRGAGAER